MTNNLATLLLALSLHESNNNDFAVGKRGEVSRYQVMPQIWRMATLSRNWRSPAIANSVACKIIRERWTWFKNGTKREPTPQEFYAMWNAPGLFMVRSYRLESMPPEIQERCERFARTLQKVESQKVILESPATAPKIRPSARERPPKVSAPARPARKP